MNIKVNGRYYPVVDIREVEDIYKVQYKHSRGVSTILLLEEDLIKRVDTTPKKIRDMMKKAQQNNGTVFNLEAQRELARTTQLPLSPKLHYAAETDLIGFRYNNQTLIGVVNIVDTNCSPRGKCTTTYVVRVMNGRASSYLITVRHADVLAIVPQLRLQDGFADYQYGHDVNLDYGVGQVVSWETGICTDGRKRDVRKLHLRSTVKNLLNLLNIEPEVVECYPTLNG